MGMSSLKIFLTIKAMRKKQFKPLFESVNNFTYTGVTKKNRSQSGGLCKVFFDALFFANLFT